MKSCEKKINTGPRLFNTGCCRPWTRSIFRTTALLQKERYTIRRGDWLLIFDNADTPEMIVPYVPAHGGHVLVTSRASVFRCLGISVPLKLEKWPQKVAIDFLLSSLGKAATSEEDKEAAKDVAIAIDGLPLALDEAAQFLAAIPDIISFAHSLKTQGIGEWFNNIKDPGYDKSTATVWQISFSRLREHHPASVELLQLLALLAPDAIPFGLLTEGSGCLGPLLNKELDGADTDSMKLLKLLHPLDQFSLIDINLKDNTLDIHRMVQATTRDAMDDASVKMWRQRVIEAVERTFPALPYDNLSRCRRLASNAVIACSYVEHPSPNAEISGSLCLKLANYLADIEKYVAAESSYKIGLQIHSTALGTTHKTILDMRYGLARLLIETCRYVEAEEILLQNLEIQRANHKQTHGTLYELARVYAATGRYGEAEEIHENSLRFSKYVPKHINLAIDQYALAKVCRSTGRYDEADNHIKIAIERVVSILGETHPNFAYMLHELGRVRYETGRYDEARQLFNHVLDVVRPTIGEGTPFFADNLFWMAHAFWKSRELDAAKQLLQQATEIRAICFGRNHPTTIESQSAYDRLCAVMEKRLS